MKACFWDPCISATLLMLLILHHHPKFCSSFPCDNDPSIPGFNNMDELDEFIFDELIFHLQGEPNRSPPYDYHLCPNTVYDITSKTFFPFLDETYFICGMDGSRDNNCIIRGGPLQVVIRDIHELDEIDHVHENTYFFGFTFEESGGPTGDGTSVLAIDSVGTAVYFFDCIWRSGTGLGLIQAIFIDLAPTPTPSPAKELSDVPSMSPSSVTSDGSLGRRSLQEQTLTGMNVTLVDCEIETSTVSDPQFRLLTFVSSRLSISGTQFSFNSGPGAIAGLQSSIHISNSTFRSNDMLFVNLLLRSRATIFGTEYRNNQAVAAIYAYKSNDATLKATSFIDNVVGSNVQLEEGTMDASLLIFDNTLGNADVVVTGGGFLDLSDSCLLNGKYAVTPILVDANSTLNLNLDNFARGLNSQQQQEEQQNPSNGLCISPPGAFFEQDGSDCLFGDVCMGDCKFFAGTTCHSPLPPMPSIEKTSAEPTLAPASVPSTPTFVSSSSPQPTASPIWEEDESIDVMSNVAETSDGGIGRREQMSLSSAIWYSFLFIPWVYYVFG